MTLAERYLGIDVFAAFDHAQLEIRVLAQMSKDKLLIELIDSGEDIHSAVGHELTGISIAKIKDDRDTRTTVKGIHFGIIYGLTEETLYFKLKTTAAERKEKFDMGEEEVKELYRRYFKRFKGVKEWLDEQIEFAVEHGYVETLFGFKREISQVPDEERTTYWRNQAVNTPIQGTAHQLMLIAMAVLEMKKQTYHLLQRLCMEVHDSLVAYTALEELPETYRQGIQLLERGVLEYIKKHWPELNWQVPLKAEAKAGFRLGVLVKDYKGGPVDEFLEEWCQQNKKFEDKMRKQIKASVLV